MTLLSVFITASSESRVLQPAMVTNQADFIPKYVCIGTRIESFFKQYKFQKNNYYSFILKCNFLVANEYVVHYANITKSY